MRMRGGRLRRVFAAARAPGPYLGPHRGALAAGLALAAALVGLTPAAAAELPAGQAPPAVAASAGDRVTASGWAPADPGEARAALVAIERERGEAAARLRADEARCRQGVLVNDCLQRVRERGRREARALKDREVAARALLREHAAQEDNRARAEAAARAGNRGDEQRRRDDAAARRQRRLAGHREQQEQRAAREARRAGEAEAARARRVEREAELARRRALAGEREAAASARAARHERKLREVERRNAQRERNAARRREQAMARAAAAMERHRAAAPAAGQASAPTPAAAPED